MVKILLVEDDVMNREMIARYLTSEGYQVISAGDGANAVLLARKELPDLILMDIQMPGMDGLEATRRIRADSDMPQMPIIALTALAMPGDRERCLMAGATDYLSKPISLKGLLAKLETYLHSAAYDDFDCRP